MKLKRVNWVRITQNFNKKAGSEIHAGFLIWIKPASTIEPSFLKTMYKVLKKGTLNQNRLERYKKNHNQSSVVFWRIELEFTIYYKSACRNMDIIGW